MEEQKNKEVKMGVITNQDNNETPNKKPTFEELYAAYMDLANKYQRVVQQLQQANRMLQTFDRLDYLFKVVECDHNNRNNSVSFASEFVEKCIGEIQDLMTLPETPEEAKEN